MLRHPLFLKATLLLYLACLIGLISAYFVISTMEIPYAAYLQGPSTLAPGKAHAFRGRIVNAQNNLTLRRVHAASLSLASPGAAAHTLGKPAIGPDGKFTLQHVLPQDFPQGPYTLTLEVVISPSQPTFTASAPILVSKAPADPSPSPLSSDTRYPKEVRTLRHGIYEGTGDVRIHVIPAHGELPRGLGDTIYLLTTERVSGKPLSCTLTFTLKEGIVTPPIPPSLRTNALGLVPLDLSAQGTLQWELQASCPRKDPGALPLEGLAKAQWLTVPSQLSMLRLDPLASDALRATFASIYRQGIVYADLYDHTDHWLWAGSFGVRDRQGGIQIPILPTTKGPLRLQLSHEYFDLGHSWDMRSFSTLPDTDAAIAELLASSSTVEGAPEWAAWLHGHVDTLSLSPPQRHRLLTALLRAQPITRQDHPALLDSAVKDRAELERWKDAARTPLLTLIVAAMLLGLLGLLLAVAKGLAQGKARQRLYDEVALELDQAPESAPSQRLFVVQTIVVIGTLMLFACSMVFLLLLL